MATTLQFRRGTAAAAAAFTGAEGEVFLDLTNMVFHVHDGIVQGGYAIANDSDITLDYATSQDPVTTNSITLGGLTMTGDIVPDADITRDLGSPSRQWRDIYVGPGSLYVNGQQVISDNSGTITVSADPDQTLQMQTSGIGNVQLSCGASGLIQLAGTVQITTGYAITDSAGAKVEFGDVIDMNNNKIVELAAPSADTDASTKKYVDDEIAAIPMDIISEGDSSVSVSDSGSGTVSVTVDGSAALTVNSTDTVIAGNLTVNGTNTTLHTSGLTVDDNIITLNADSGAVPSENAGIEVERGDSSNVSVVFNEASDSWTFTNDGSSFNPIPVSTADLQEITNLYYTQARFDAAFTSKSTSSLNEGTNLYYTQGRFDSAFAAKSTTDLSEGTNLYYTQSRFNSDLAASDTDDLSEGASNLYHTTARARAAISAGGDASYNSTTGVLSVTTYKTADFGTDLAASDTDDLSEGASNLYHTTARARATISGTGDISYDSGTGVISYTGADTLDEVTSNGATTTNAITVGGATINGNIVTTGQLHGPATLTIDPAAIGDNTGTVVIAGDLQVDGTTTTINSTNLAITDLQITVADGAANAAAANGGGLKVDLGTDGSANLTYVSATDNFNFDRAAHITGNRILTVADEGTGNGLDADTLDGQHGSFYRNASNINAGTINDARLPASISSDISGNAATATTASACTGNAATATTASNATLTDESSDTTCNVVFATAANGNLPLKTGTNLTFNASTGLLTASSFAGNLTGNVTGNASTATKLATARTIDITGDITATAVAFDGSANISISAAVNNDSHSHSNYLLNNANDTTSGSITSSSHIIAGDGGGSVGLSVNDGYGNANVTFNHFSGMPDVTGNAGRISVNVDTTTNPSMTFGLGEGVTAGVAGAITTYMTLSDTSLQVVGNIMPNTSNTYNIGSATTKYANVYATTFQGTSTTAQYADLAEKYTVEGEPMVGQVILIGGENTDCVISDEVASFAVLGVMSENPAFKMNSEADGEYIALKGRVPCKVLGPVKKGEPLVSGLDGRAIGISQIAEELRSTPGIIFAKALEASEGMENTIEVVVL